MTDVLDATAGVTEPTEDERRAAFVAGLRAAADFFERTPDAPLPTAAYLHRTFYSDDAKAQLADGARNLGNVEKDVDDWDFKVTRDFGGGVRYTLRARRDLVCERVEVGTRQVERQVPVGDVTYATVTEDEMVYEYICPPSLLRPDADDAEVSA